MASETPDPSSSELLTDFDIADVETWDDQNDNSKEIGLVKMSGSYASSHGFSRSNSLPLHVNSSPSATSFTSMEHLERLTSSLQNPVTVSSAPFQAHSGMPTFARNHSSDSVPQPSMQNFQEPAQSTGTLATGLATLRALAQAQEEQARLIKEQERARQEAQQARLIKEQEMLKEQERLKQEALKTSARLASQAVVNEMNPTEKKDSPTLTSPEIISISSSEESQNEGLDAIHNQSSSQSISLDKQLEQSSDKIAVSTIESAVNHVTAASTNTQNNAVDASTKVLKSSPQLATLQLPIGDKKGKSVVQLKGQLVRTQDQKLMLVTEVGGKKVGYLISPQSGQLQSAVAAQLLAKNAQGSDQVQLSVVNSASSKSNAAESTAKNSVTSPAMSVTPTSNLSDEACSPHELSSMSKLSPLESGQGRESLSGVSVKGDGDSPRTERATSLKNKNLEISTADDKTKKKRRGKGKGKKKKDSNEPPKPISPYLMFFKDVQPIVRQQNPSAGLGEVSKLVSQRWEKATVEEKQTYTDRSTKAKQEYQIKLAEYRASLAAESDNTPVSTPSEQRGTSTQPIILNQDQPMDCIDADSAENDVTIPSMTEAVDSPVYNYVTTERTEAVKNNNSTDTSENTAIISTNQYVAADVEMDEDTSTSEDPSTTGGGGSGGKKSRQKASKKSKNREKIASDDVKRNKLMKLNIDPEDDDDDDDMILAKSKSKKSKKKHKPIETLKSPPKLTMKINIKDSKITESPTKSPSFEEDFRKETLKQKDESSIAEETGQKPSTQPKALQSFKIPKRASSPTEGKASNDVGAKRDTKNSSHRQCAQDGCDNPTKTTRERGSMYCSNQCLVNHCRSAFQSWVLERKSEASES